MWVLFAVGSAFFAGVTSILAKCGIKNTDSTVATAIRTLVILPMSVIMVLIVGSMGEITSLSAKTWIFLVLSGVATGASWLCYFKALQTGDVNKVVPIDKSSTVLTILLAFIILGEPISWLKGICVVLIAAGTFLMIEKKREDNEKPAAATTAETTAVTTAAMTETAANASTGEEKRTKKSWLFYAILSATFAALTSILGKIGISGTESNLGTMIRNAVVLVMSWVVVFATGKTKHIHGISGKELGFICLSGVTTGASWFCYYKALHDGLASVVVPIDKLSILVTIAFSFFMFKEKLSLKALIGLVLIVAGTLLMLVNV